jgi:hypothetical protein
MFSRLRYFSIAVAIGSLFISNAYGASWLEKNFWLSGPRYDRVMPGCDYPRALDRIIADLRSVGTRFWNSELQILGFENMRETAVLPWAAQSVPRRFCSGTVLINDGLRHQIYYSIAEDAGMIGMDWGVNFCIVGIDRSWAYNSACRSAQP